MGINAADAAYEARRQQQLEAVLGQMESERQAKIAETQKVEESTPPVPEDLWTDRPERQQVLEQSSKSLPQIKIEAAMKLASDIWGGAKLAGETVPAVGSAWRKQDQDLRAFLLENPMGMPRLPGTLGEVQKAHDNALIDNDLVRGIPVFGDLLGPKTDIREELIEEARRKALAAEMDMRAKLPKTDNVIEQGVVDTTLNLGMMLPSIAASIATRNPNVGLAMMGTQAGITGYGDARRAGADPTKAWRYGLTQGAIEVVTERLPMKFLVGDIAKKTPFLEALKKQMIADGLGEQVATHLQDLSTWLELNPEATFADYLAERPDAITRTAITSAMMSTIFAGASRAGSALTKDAPEETAPEATPDTPQEPAQADTQTPDQSAPDGQQAPQEAAPDAEKLAEVEAVAAAVEQAEAQQASPEDRRAEEFLAEYEAILGPDAVIEEDFKRVVVDQPEPGPEGTLGRGIESLVEEQQAANPPVPEARQDDSPRPQETSFRSYFGRKSFRQQNAIDAPPTTEEQIAVDEAVETLKAQESLNISTPDETTARPANLSDDEVNRIAERESKVIPEVAAAEDMLATAESVYDEVVSKEMLTALDDQFDMPAERVREIMDKAIEGRGSVKTFNTLMKRVAKVRDSGIRYARNQGQTAREEMVNWDRRQKLILAGERAWGWQFMDALKAGRIQFTDKAGMSDLGETDDGTMAMTYVNEGRVVINDEAVTPADMAGILLHEVGVHAGLMGLVGESGFYQVLDAGRTFLAEAQQAFENARNDMLMLGRSDEYVFNTLPLAHRQALMAGDVVGRLYSDQNEVIQAEEFLANLIDRSPESNFVQAIVGRLKAWMAQRFPKAIKYLNWTTHDFRQLAIVSLRKFGSDSLNMPIKYRKGYEADGVSLILSRPIKKRPRMAATLNRVVKTVDLRDINGFQKAVQDAREELLSSETLDRLLELNPQLDPFAYRDAVEQVAETGNADAAFDLSQMLEPLRGEQVPVNVRYARRPNPQTQERDFFDPYSYPRPYLNLNRIQGYEDFKAYIRELADDAAPEVAQKVGPKRTLDQVEREAASENAFAALARRRKGNILTDREMLALRWLRDASAQKVREVAAVAGQTDSKAAKAALLRVIHLHRAIQAEVSGASADASRLLGSLRILSEAKSVRAMELSDAVANWNNNENVNDLIKKINRLSETQQVELDSLIEVGFKQAWTDLGGAWIRALFLSNPKTHIVNALGNQLTMALNVGETFIGGMLTADQTLMSEAGQRFGAMVDAYWHQLKYMKEHSQFNPLKRGFSLKFDDLGVSGHQVDAGGNQRALSASRVSSLTGGLVSVDENSVIGRTIEIMGYGLAAPSEALGVADDLFKGVNYRMEMRGLAYQQAVREARGGLIDQDQINMRVEEIMAEPAEEIVMRARRAAQERTFTNRPGPITMSVLRFRRALNNLTGFPIGHFLLPFVITPSNIFSYTFRHLPSAAFFPEWREQFARGGQDRARAVGQVAMGTSVLSLGIALGMGGVLTGSGPNDREEKKQLMSNAALGWQPYSARIGDHYVTLDRLDPVSSMLFIGAEIGEIYSNMGWDHEPDDQFFELMAASSLHLGRMLLDKSYLTGLRDFVRALDDEEGNFADSYFARASAAITTPAVGAEIRRQEDPFLRDAYGAIQQIKNRIPGLSSTLPKVYDDFGRPRLYQSGLGMAYDALSPFIAKKVKPEPIDEELMRLRYMPSPMDRTLAVPVGSTGQRVGVQLREEMAPVYARMTELMGASEEYGLPPITQELNALVKSDYYQQLMDGPNPLMGSKSMAIRDVLSERRQLVRSIVVQEFWGELQQAGREELTRQLAREAQQQEQERTEIGAAMLEALAQQ